MKKTALIGFSFRGNVYEAGDSVEVPDEMISRFETQGLIELGTHKISKPAEPEKKSGTRKGKKS